MRPLYDSCVLVSTQATKDPYSDTDSNNMLAVVSTPRQLVHQVGGSVKCDSSSMVAGATRLVVGASGTTIDGGVRFPTEFSVTTGSFTLG